MFRFNRMDSSGDRWLLWVLRGSAVIAGGVTLLVILFLVAASVPAFQHLGVVRFFTDASWHPAEYAAEGTFNLWPMLVGSLLVTAGAVLIAAPLGVGAAVFCQYYAPGAVAATYRRAIELLAGIPSVVFGFWGLIVLVPMINQWHPPGQSLLAAVLILSLMILPTIAMISDASMAQLPDEYRFSAEALGLTRWATVRGVMLPAAAPGVLTGLILATGRAIGETLAVLMVCGNIVQIPTSAFEPVRTLTANIALEMAYAAGDHRASLFVTGLILTFIVVALVFIVEKINRRFSSLIP
ncbi:MAG: phosphate ABC transporter permease subunit PstC [Verrucomicrobiales bacterium]|nr:phosphate ABC transporter permease subunit PstC [Verrucomicrobiales bacterium]